VHNPRVPSGDTRYGRALALRTGGARLPPRQSAALTHPPERHLATDPLQALPENASVRRYLEAGAEPASSDHSLANPRLGGWELRCHPDLVERLEEAALAVGIEPAFLYGLPVLIHPDGVAFATARGTSLVLLRLPGDARDGVQRSRWGTEDLDDAAWVDVEPWLDLPGAQPLERLSEWVVRAFEHAATVGG